MANTTFYNRGDAYHDSAGNPAIIKRGNELTFTEHFNAGGGGGTPYTPPAYSTEEHKTGRKWIGGRDIYEKTLVFSEPVNITTSYTVIETNTSVDVPISANAIDPTYKACMPLKAGVENGNLAVIAFDAQFTAETVTIEYVKALAQTLTNTRTVKKTVKKG